MTSLAILLYILCTQNLGGWSLIIGLAIFVDVIFYFYERARY